MNRGPNYKIFSQWQCVKYNHYFIDGKFPLRFHGYKITMSTKIQSIRAGTLTFSVDKNTVYLARNTALSLCLKVHAK